MDFEVIKERDFLPEELRESTIVVKAMYGHCTGSHSHTQLFFGQLSFQFIPHMATLWLLPPPSIPFSLLAGAKNWWPLIRPLFAPELYAHANCIRNARFLSFLGLEPVGELDGVQYFKETLYEY